MGSTTLECLLKLYHIFFNGEIYNFLELKCIQIFITFFLEFHKKYLIGQPQ